MYKKWTFLNRNPITKEQLKRLSKLRKARGDQNKEKEEEAEAKGEEAKGARALNPVDKNSERITQKLRKQAEELN